MKIQGRITLSICFIFVFISSLKSQTEDLYVITDKDGYTNVREKNSVESKILRTLQNDEVVFSADYIGDSPFTDEEKAKSNWIPLLDGGFVYKTNVTNFISLKSISAIKKNNNILSFSYKLTTVNIIYKPFNPKNHDIAISDTKGILVDNIRPRPYFIIDQDGNPINNLVEIDTIEIKFRNNKTVVPKQYTNAYFFNNSILEPQLDEPENFPGIDVYAGENNSIYIIISGGDGGEHFVIYWSIRNGELKYSNLLW